MIIILSGPPYNPQLEVREYSNIKEKCTFDIHYTYSRKLPVSNTEALFRYEGPNRYEDRAYLFLPNTYLKGLCTPNSVKATERLLL